MAAPTFTPLPTSPNRETSPETFSTDADAFLGALPTFQTEGNTLGTYCETQADSALTSANNAAQSAASAGAVLWVSGTSYSAGYVVYSPINFQNYRCIISTSSTTDPSLDSVNWTYLGGNLSIDDNATSTAITIDSSGNVGIGTASPDGRLHVAGSGAQVFLEESDATANGSHEFKITALKQGVGFNVLTLGGWEHWFNVGGAQGQAAKIDSSGIFYVGKGTTAFGAIGSYIGADGTAGFSGATTPLSLNRVAGTTGEIASFWYNTVQVGSVTVTASATAYNTSSDYRLKENITPIQNAGDIVKAMQPVTYTFKSDGSWHDGFLAHELQELHPRAVIGSKDAMQDEDYEVTPAVEATYDDEGVELTPAVPAVMGTRSVPDYQGVDYSKLTPILTAALQEALNKIDALEARLTALEVTP